MSMMPQRSVLISGAGIAGPTLAFWLARRGFAPTIVEHSAALRTGGYVIDFWGVGYTVAERMGILPRLRQEGYDVEKVIFVDASGRQVGGFAADVFRRLTAGRYFSILRADLARAIVEGDPRATELVFDDSIVDLRQRSSHVNVTFASGASRQFDLVIGADGQHSGVRALAFGEEERFERYLGYMVGAFIADGYRPRDELAYVSHSAPGRQIGRFALRDGRTVFLFVFASDVPVRVEPHDSEMQKRALRSAFAGVGWECPSILALLDGSPELYFDRASQVRIDRWRDGRIALVGDAAFAPSLLAGQGAALAMTAAYVLAGELQRAGDDFDLAFRRYESLLRPMLSAKQDAAERFAGSFAPRSSWGLWVRNQVTRAFGVPGVAKMVLGRDLVDSLDLPDYPPLACTVGAAGRQAENG